MTDIVLEFDHVWKKFKKGERYDSLRDLIPSMTRKLLKGRSDENELTNSEFWAIKDVSFGVNKGEALGIIGPNGAGKSTMLKLLSRILKPNEGHITANGRLSALIEVGAGFHPDLTGRENIYLNGAILGMKKHEIDRKLDEIVDFAGLAEFIDTPVKRFSSGMYARLGFSVAAHIDPEILLVDEVLSVGDMRFQQKCLERMHKIVSNGVTVIFVSHNLESVQTLCPKALYLQRGQLKVLGNTSDVIKEYVRATKKVDGFDDSPDSMASITGIELFNEKSKPSNSFSPGDKIQLKFLLKCREPLEECLLGFIVEREETGLIVCDYNLELGKISKGNDPVGAERLPLIVSFEANLLRGTYAVTLHVRHYPKAKFLYHAYRIAVFSIEERISWEGISHLNPILEHGDRI